jgi:hypothetical protein
MDMKMNRVQNFSYRINLRIVSCFAAAVWIGITSWAWGKEGLQLTHEENLWINEHPVVRVVANFGPPPLSLWGDNQKLKWPTRPPQKEALENRLRPPLEERIRPLKMKGGPMGRPGAGETYGPLIKVRADDQDDF